MNDFRNKTVVVTGGASGIGLGIANAFAREGASIVLCDIRAEPLEDAVSHVRALGVQVIGILTDVSDRASLEEAAAAVEREFGRIDLVFNNAGIAMHGASIEQVSLR